jgi:hypothetical protein
MTPPPGLPPAPLQLLWRLAEALMWYKTVSSNFYLFRGGRKINEPHENTNFHILEMMKYGNVLNKADLQD